MDLRDRLTLRPPDLGREWAEFTGALSVNGLGVTERNRTMDRSVSRFEAEAKDNAATLSIAGKPEAPVRRELGELVAEGESAGAIVEAQRKSVRRARGRVLEKAGQLRQLNADGIVSANTRGFYDAFAAPDPGGAFYRAIEPTREWAETNYYRLPIGSHTFALIPESSFWLDGSWFASTWRVESFRKFGRLAGGAAGIRAVPDVLGEARSRDWRRPKEVCTECASKISSGKDELESAPVPYV